MKFESLCRAAKGVKITVLLRQGKEVAYFPESFEKHEHKQELDLNGLSWLTQARCKPFRKCYVTNIEPTGRNTMNVTVVPWEVNYDLPD